MPRLQSHPSDSASDARVRLVFSDTIRDLDLPRAATLCDLALRLGEPDLEALGRPCAIDIAWPAPGRAD